VSAPDTFTCALCGGIFRKGQTDEAAMAECRYLFDDMPPDEPLALVCDDCFRQVYPEASVEGRLLEEVRQVCEDLGIHAHIRKREDQP
jgi:hypothetical protein